MKIIEGYMLKEIAGNFVAIPVGQSVIDYKSMLHLNETGAFIWKKLETGIEYSVLLSDMAAEYEATEEEKSIIQADLDEFLGKIKDMKLLSE